MPNHTVDWLEIWWVCLTSALKVKVKVTLRSPSISTCLTLILYLLLLPLLFDKLLKFCMVTKHCMAFQIITNKGACRNTHYYSHFLWINFDFQKTKKLFRLCWALTIQLIFTKHSKLYIKCAWDVDAITFRSRSLKVKVILVSTKSSNYSRIYFKLGMWVSLMSAVSHRSRSL